MTTAIPGSCCVSCWNATGIRLRQQAHTGRTELGRDWVLKSRSRAFRARYHGGVRVLQAESGNAGGGALKPRGCRGCGCLAAWEEENSPRRLKRARVYNMHMYTPAQPKFQCACENTELEHRASVKVVAMRTGATARCPARPVSVRRWFGASCWYPAGSGQAGAWAASSCKAWAAVSTSACPMRH